MSQLIPITLHHYWRSSCSWRVRWALNIKGVAYVDRIVDLLNGDQNSPAFRQINPLGYIPVIETPSGVFGESMAILEWLEESYPHPPLLPQSAAERAFVRQIAQMIVSGIQPLQNLVVLKHWSPDASEQSKYAAHWINLGLLKLEKLLNLKHSAGTFCVGSQLTLADICLVPQVYNAIRYGLDVNNYPISKRIYEHCLTLPECLKAAPQNQPGAK